jgi:hypothetical protein
LELDLYVALHYSSSNQQFPYRNIVSLTANLIQTAYLSDVPIMPIFRGVLGVTAGAGLAMYFKPLLTGIVRALVLTVRPRRTKAELAARGHMRDAQLVQRMINSSNDPSHAAELRAMAARA